MRSIRITSRSLFKPVQYFLKLDNKEKDVKLYALVDSFRYLEYRPKESIL